MEGIHSLPFQAEALPGHVDTVEMKPLKRKKRRDGKVRTLIVDDSLVVRASLTEFLGSLAGMDVVGTATNGAEAIELIADRRPHLVIMDLNMPVMDGLQALRLIRQRNRRTRVIMMTTTCGQEVKASCFAAGADAFVGKQQIWRELETAIMCLFPKLRQAGPPVPRRTGP